MKKFNSFRNRQNGFEDLGSGTAEAAKTKKKLVESPRHYSCDSGNRYFYF